MCTETHRATRHGHLKPLHLGLKLSIKLPCWQCNEDSRWSIAQATEVNMFGLCLHEQVPDSDGIAEGFCPTMKSVGRIGMASSNPTATADPTSTVLVH